MSAYYQDDWLTVHLGDCREVMASMEPESVHCVVTSPPYWGLRDYGTPGQLGLEATPEAYVESMVAVFREVRRVLRSDGTVWLNLGDSYAANRSYQVTDSKHIDVGNSKASVVPDGLKPKDLVGIPWRVAFALQADGWYLRSDIIWSKPNPMPESVTDRPTKSHEYLFLLSKSPRYYFDSEAVRLPGPTPQHRNIDSIQMDGEARPPGTHVHTGLHRASDKQRGHSRRHAGFNDRWDNMDRAGQLAGGANIRSVWTIATQPYPGAHFATFPQKLVEPCIKAGTSERGVCPECGDPWERETERDGGERYATGKSAAKNGAGLATAFSGYTDGSSAPTFITTGWQRTCAHDALPVAAVVMDPFAGSGTTGLVAQRLSRRAVLIDLNGDYLEQVMERNRDLPLGLGA